MQQQQTQDALTAAIKAQQSRSQDAAFAQALQGAGVVPSGVNVSGMSGPALAKLAELYQGTIPDTDEDKAKQALANYHNAAATSLWEYPGGKGTSGVDFSEHAVGDTWISEDGLRMIMTRTGPKIAQGFTQPTVQSRPRDISTYTRGNDIDADSAWENPNDPNSMQVPTFDPNYDPSKPTSPTNQMYKQAINPNYDPNGAKDATNPPTITHTVTVPKNVWQQYKTGGSGGGGTGDQSGTGGGGGTSQAGTYKVGDSITLKDGSTKTITAINPDGSYQVQ